MKNIRIIVLLIGTLLVTNAYAVNVDVRIYAKSKIKEIEIEINSGKYQVVNPENNLVIVDLYKNSKVRFTISNDNKVRLWKNGELIGGYDQLLLNGVGFMNTFELEPLSPSLVSRMYDDNLKLSVVGGNLLLVNNVKLESYVAGVVESEGGGSTRDIDFFFVQAITCRTYALNNIRKHHDEGYNLCDQTHCQVYKGRCSTSDIMMAAAQTAGQVIVDQEGKMISAAFHSNSGGYTMNSEDVWTIATPYLKAIEDTFSLRGKHASWQKVVDKDVWVNYFALNYNYPVEDSLKLDAIINFEQSERQKYFVDSIPLKLIRSDFKLKSTFFSVYDRGEFVLLNGKGFGHGVGLSQEGAIHMVELGFTFEEIIKFYYQDVEIVNYKDLNYFFINYYN